MWWANLADASGSGPGFRRPVVIVSADRLNSSAINTVTIATLTTNIARASAPGNVLVTRANSGLPRGSVINVSQLLTVDKQVPDSRVGLLPARYIKRLDDGLRIALDLGP